MSEQGGHRPQVRPGSERGASSIEFVGVIPAAILVVLITAQFVSAGWALWSASVAARAGARAAHVGSPAEDAALGALPEALREAAVIKDGGGGVISARVPVPRMLPVLPRFRVEAKSGMEPSGG